MKCFTQEGRTRAVMEDRFSAGSDHPLLKRRPSTGTSAAALRVLSKRPSIGALSKCASHFVRLMTVVGLVLGHQAALADERGRGGSAVGSFAAFPFSRDFNGRRLIITQQLPPKAARNLKRVGVL